MGEEMPVEDRIKLFVKTRGPISRTNLVCKSAFRDREYDDYTQRYSELTKDPYLVMEHMAISSLSRASEISLRAYMAL